MDKAEFERWRREYHPCEHGVSIFQSEGGEFGGLTLRNYPNADPEITRQLSSAGDGDDFDLIADIYEHGNLVDTIPIRRQDLALIEKAYAEIEATND